MSIKIFNTLTGKKEEFKPIKKGKVGMYVCGVTVYDESHIGHVRGAFTFDIVRRYLEYKGYKVKYVRNITDVDDKIIERAKKGMPDARVIKEKVKQVAERFTKSYYEDMKALGIREADIEPKATEHIEDMLKLIQRLVKKEYAYERDGDVYFEVRKFKDYGKLSKQSLDQMQSGARVEIGEKKKDPLDFALWKSSKENEPFWDSPWGEGRPGWHIECSTMSMKYLGENFDIHGGGRDLVFPHHENEIAQSECATGKHFANYWLHNGILSINGQKMAKSLRNFISVKDVIAKYSPDVLKLFFLQTHYSQPIDFSWERMEQKRNALGTIMKFLSLVKREEEGGPNFFKIPDINERLSSDAIRSEIKRLRSRFETAMDNDFNTPQALACLFEIVRLCEGILFYNTYDRNKHLRILIDARETIQELGNILGLSFKESPLSIPKEEIERLIRIRDNLRKEKMFEKADQIRKEVEKKGIILEDGKEGTTWRVK